jgi:hypothetical protein
VSKGLDGPSVGLSLSHLGERPDEFGSGQGATLLHLDANPDSHRRLLAVLAFLRAAA